MNEVTVTEPRMYAPQTAKDIREQVNLIQAVMAEVMQGPSKENPNGIHYGLIPGCGDKPTLLKPGAEKLFLTFRLRPIIDPVGDIIITELPNGHRDYRVHCHILNMQGVEMATGVGSACTMESKHRYRGGEKKSTGQAVPKEYWNLKNAGKEKEALGLIGGSGFGVGKFEGAWMICEKGEPMENPDIADVYNTVLKMACKRAKVDGAISATACSDIFTQDIEDFHEPVTEAKAATAAAGTPPAQAKAPPAGPTAAKPAEKPAETNAAPDKGPEIATGFIMDVTEPNKGGYVDVVIDGYFRESGKPMKFSTREKGQIDSILDIRDAGEKLSVEYRENPNPAFACGIVRIIQAAPKGDAQLGD